MPSRAARRAQAREAGRTHPRPGPRVEPLEPTGGRRVLFLGDTAGTGFGTVTRDLGLAMVRRGMDVRILSMNEDAGFTTDPGWPAELKPRTVMLGLADGWLGGVTTSLGQSMELAVIAATVIGGANLMGGSGTVIGAVVGAALIEVIRNSLILLGISTFWQGCFVGSFIIIAVMFDRIRGSRRAE